MNMESRFLDASEMTPIEGRYVQPKWNLPPYFQILKDCRPRRI